MVRLKDLGLLALRVTVGGFVAGHGAQKLFGSFQGPGLDAAGQGFEHMGLAPGRQMAATAGALEMTGGALTALGLASPIGPFTIASVMAVATGTAHRDRQQLRPTGGGELPLTNVAAALALAATGPGALSMDRLLRARVPRSISIATFVVATASAAAVIAQHVQRTRAQAQDHDAQMTLPIDADAPEGPAPSGPSDIDLRARAERTEAASS